MANETSSGNRDDWVECLGRAAAAFKRSASNIVPRETRGHLRRSRKEFLLALRSMLDRQIEDLEEPPRREARNVDIS